jgi:hypothetical protein
MLYNQPQRDLTMEVGGGTAPSAKQKRNRPSYKKELEEMAEKAGRNLLLAVAGWIFFAISLIIHFFN